MRLAWILVVATSVACGIGGGLIAGCGSSRSSVFAGPIAQSTASGPYLTALEVSGASSITMVPAFSSSIHDYYVRCAAGANALRVSMTASTGAESALVHPKSSASRPEQTVSLNVAENDAIVATATEGATTTEYWVRCLPHDFPLMQMSLHQDVGVAVPGYYLIGNRQRIANTEPYAMVLDVNGVPIWYFHETRGPGVYNVDSVVRGTISFDAPNNEADPLPYEVHQLSPWKTTFADNLVGTVLDEHELRALPNGHFLVLSRPLLDGVDLTGLQVLKPTGGVANFGANSYIVDCNVLEVDSKGQVAWRWTGSEHFDAQKESTFPLLRAENAPDGSPVTDPFHCNSIDVDPATGNLLVSARQMDAVFYVDRSTSKILWKMGGTPYSKDHATYVGVPDPFYRQHDARLLPGWRAKCNGGTGQVTVFDDETDRRAPARAAVYDVVVGGTGAVADDCDGTDAGDAPRADLVWSFSGKTMAVATGSFRILADGSRVIGWGLGPTPNLVFTEVDIAGNDLLDFYFTDNNSSYRAIKVPLDTFELGVLRRTAGTSSDLDSNDGGMEDDGGVAQDGSNGDDGAQPEPPEDAGDIDASVGDSGDTDGDAESFPIVSDGSPEGPDAEQ